MNRSVLDCITDIIYLSIPGVFRQCRVGAGPLLSVLPNTIHSSLSYSQKELPLVSSYLMAALLLTPHSVYTLQWDRKFKGLELDRTGVQPYF